MRLLTGFNNSSLPIPGCTGIRFDLVRSADEFAIKTTNSTAATAKAQKVHVQINSISLNIKIGTLEEGLFKSMMSAWTRGEFKFKRNLTHLSFNWTHLLSADNPINYVFRHFDIDAKSLAAQQTHFKHALIGEAPSRLLLAFVDADAFDGNFTKDPFR